MVRYSLLPVLKKFLVTDEGLNLKMTRRGLPPGGGGVVHFSCPIRRSLKAFQVSGSVVVIEACFDEYYVHL